MSIHHGHRLPARATLSSVAAGMAKPIVVESAKRGGDTLANGGHMARPFRRVRALASIKNNDDVA